MLSEPPDDLADRIVWRREAEETFADKVRRRLTQIVVGAYETYLGTLTAAGDLSAFDAIPQQWQVYVLEELIPDLDEMYQAGAITAWNTAPTTTTLPTSAATGWAQIIAANAIDYQAQATNRLAGVGDDIWRKVNSQVTDALQKGASTEDLKKGIEQVTQFSEFRADTIARTEMNAAFVNGAYQGEVALGEYGPVYKEWLPVGDNRMRPEHEAMMGQPPIPFGDDFIVGDEPMAHPLADGASAANVVNCRCDVLFYYPGDTLPDGTLVEAPATMSQAVEVADDVPDNVRREEERRQQRLANQRQYYRDNRATLATAQEAAAKWNTTVDDIIAYRADVQQVRRAIRNAAADRQVELYGVLERVEGGTLRLPTQRNAGFDPLKNLSTDEKNRYLRWFDKRAGSTKTTLEDMAESARRLGLVDRNLGDDQVLEWHRAITRDIDAAGAVKKGQLPSTRIYGNIDPNTLVTLPDIDVRQILGVHVDDAAGYLATLDKARYADEAYSALGQAVASEAPPWRMGFQSWSGEVLDTDWLLSNAPTPALRERMSELIPPQFDSPGASLEDIYSAIIQAARIADLEVADYAVIPWA
jgi:hypothetical protein